MESFLVFSARTAIERTDYGLKQSIDLTEKLDGTKTFFVSEFSNYESLLLGMIHVYVHSDGLASAIISDRDYRQRVAHNLLIKVKINIVIY